MPSLVYLSLGGNLGQPSATLKQCIEALENWGECEEVQAAPLYQTSPVDMEQEASPFINTAVKLKTSLSPQAFKLACQKLEKDLGKEPKPKNAPRLVDIDIILFGKEWIEDPDLSIPHPRWQDRLFVLVPLKDLADKIWVPRSSNTGEWLDLTKLIEAHPNPHNEQIIDLLSGQTLIEPSKSLA